MAIVRLTPQISAQLILVTAKENGINPELLRDSVIKIVDQIYNQGLFIAAPEGSQFIRQMRQYVANQNQNQQPAQQPAQQPVQQVNTGAGNGVPVAAHQHSQVYQNPNYPAAPAQEQTGQGVQVNPAGHQVPETAPVMAGQPAQNQGDAPPSMTEGSGAPPAPTIMD